MRALISALFVMAALGTAAGQHHDPAPMKPLTSRPAPKPH